MELRLLRYFVAVAEELNVTRAAERLRTAQPSLSQQIRQLEGLIGAPLFIRDKHRLRLTRTGEVLLPAARAVQEQVEAALSDARAAARDEGGSILLGIVPGPESKVFSHVLPTLLHNHAEIQVALRTNTSPELLRALTRREITAAFLRGPIESDEIAWEVYIREEAVVVLPEAWDLAALERIPVAMLATRPMIPTSPTVAPAIQQVAVELERRCGVTFQPGLCSENLMTSMNAAAAGLGFFFFPKYVGEILPKGLVTRPIDIDPPPMVDLLFAYRKDDPNPALQVLIGLVQQYSPYRLAGGRT